MLHETLSHSLFTTKNAFADSSPPCKLLPSLLLQCMDIHPNPDPLFKNSLKIKIHNRLNLLNCLLLQKRSNANLSVTSTIYKITSITGRTTSSLKDLYLNAGPPFLRTILTFMNSGENIKAISGRKYLKLLIRDLKNNSPSQRNAYVRTVVLFVLIIITKSYLLWLVP